MERQSGQIQEIVKLQFEQSSQSLLNSIGDLIDTKGVIDWPLYFSVEALPGRRKRLSNRSRF